MLKNLDRRSIESIKLKDERTVFEGDMEMQRR
jgi:hypothetical protein